MASSPTTPAWLSRSPAPRRRPAPILTRCEASDLAGDGVVLTDRLTGQSVRVRAGAVINATGVWAGQLAPEVELRPSRGTHLVLSDEALRGLGAGLFVPAPGERARFVFALPVPGERRVYVGITDEPAPGAPPDEPQPTEREITFLLDALGSVLDAEIGRDSVIGAFAGLRPLLGGQGGRTADLSRRHAVLAPPDGVITVVGGKLTTYRRMAQHAVDAALASAPLARSAARRAAGPCRTRTLPLVGAAAPRELAGTPAPGVLVARYGTEAPRVLALADEDPSLADPIADGLQVTGAELVFALRHEGAIDEADLLDRRTRIGLVPAEAIRARPAVARILAGERAAIPPLT